MYTKCTYFLLYEKLKMIWYLALSVVSIEVSDRVKVDRRVLNQQLKELEHDGILRKEVFKELPPRVEYTLTPLGKSLVEVLWKLNDWGESLLVEKNDSHC